MTTAVAPVPIPASPWRPIVSAMGKTGGSSIVSGLVSALSTKIIASMLGPGSMAVLETMQQLRDGAVVAATANGRTALVQGASQLEGVERREFLRTVAWLFAMGMIVVTAAMFAFPEKAAAFSKFPLASAPLLPWVAGAVVLLTLYIFLSGIVVALRNIGALSMLQMTSPLTAALIAWPVAVAVRTGHPLALVFFLVIPAAVTVVCVVPVFLRHRLELRGWFQGSGSWWSWTAAKRFVSISGAMLASGLVTTAVLLAVRGSITQHSSLTMTGQFDAAWNISMNQVTLILGSVQVYYLPSLAASKSALDRGRQIRNMLLVATLAAVPVITALEALKPFIVGVLYSNAFHASPGFLRWTLLGDYLKIGSWVLVTPMLASRDLGLFLGLDLLLQGIFFATALWLMRSFSPAEGASIAFVISYAVYFAGSYLFARRRYGFEFGSTSLAAWLGGLLLIAGAAAAAWNEHVVNWAGSALWIAFALAFSGGFAWYMRGREA